MASNEGVFRDSIERSLFQADAEKTRYDKLLAKEDMVKIQTIFSKPILTLSDVNHVQALLVSNEIKLTHFRGLERYINHKFYIWVSEYASRYMKAIRADEKYALEWDTLPEQVKKIRTEIQKDYAEQYKKLVNVLLFGIRSPLSQEGDLIGMLSTERKEYEYSGNLSPLAGQQNQTTTNVR